MRTLGNILNAIVSVLLFLLGIGLTLACGNVVDGVIVFALMSASAICHFLSNRIGFMLIFEGLSVLGIILSVMIVM